MKNQKPHCCKSPSLKADFTLQLHAVPFELTDDGPQYDDTKAEYSEGWDFNEQSEAYCTKCHALFQIVQDDNGKLVLEQTTQKTEVLK